MAAIDSRVVAAARLWCLVCCASLNLLSLCSHLKLGFLLNLQFEHLVSNCWLFSNLHCCLSLLALFKQHAKSFLDFGFDLTSFKHSNLLKILFECLSNHQLRFQIYSEQLRYFLIFTDLFFGSRHFDCFTLVTLLLLFLLFFFRLLSHF